MGRAVHWRPAGGWPAGCSGRVAGWEQWLGGWLGAGRLVVLLPTLIQAVHSHAARSDSRHKRARMPSLIWPCPLFAIPPAHLALNSTLFSSRSPPLASSQVVAAGPRDMRMFYHSYSRTTQRYVVGLATSPDGFKWTKAGPVFEVCACRPAWARWQAHCTAPPAAACRLTHSLQQLASLNCCSHRALAVAARLTLPSHLPRSLLAPSCFPSPSSQPILSGRLLPRRL